MIELYSFSQKNYTSTIVKYKLYQKIKKFYKKVERCSLCWYHTSVTTNERCSFIKKEGLDW